MRLPKILRSQSFRGLLIAILVALQILVFSFWQPARSQVVEAVVALKLIAKTGVGRATCYTGSYMGGNECRKPSRCVEAIEHFENVVNSNGSSASVRSLESWIGSASQNENCAVAIAGGPIVSAARNAVAALNAGVPNSISGSPDPGNASSNSPIFDANFYLMSYGDLRNAFGTNQGAAKDHWLTNGIKEGRRSSPAFDVQYYLSLYPDLQNAFGSSNYSAAIDHWLTNGIKEGRRSSIVFDVKYYLNKYPDLQNAFGSNNYSAAVNHWLTNGVSEGRQGSPDFDPKFYLSNNPDVAKVYGVNNYKGAIEHYLEYGKGEGRRGTP